VEYSSTYETAGQINISEIVDDLRFFEESYAKDYEPFGSSIGEFTYDLGSGSIENDLWGDIIEDFREQLVQIFSIAHQSVVVPQGYRLSEIKYSYVAGYKAGREFERKDVNGFHHDPTKAICAITIPEDEDLAVVTHFYVGNFEVDNVRSDDQVKEAVLSQLHKGIGEVKSNTQGAIVLIHGLERNESAEPGAKVTAHRYGEAIKDSGRHFIEFEFEKVA